MIADRTTSIEESSTIIRKGLLKYTVMRLSRTQLARLTGRSVLKESFIYGLRDSLYDDYNIIMCHEEKNDDNNRKTHFVFTTKKLVINMCTGANQCKNGRSMTNDSIDLMIRKISNPLIEKTDE